jgi:hypothetical protein
MVSTMPRPLYPSERPGTHCTRGWINEVVKKKIPEFMLQHNVPLQLVGKYFSRKLQRAK